MYRHEIEAIARDVQANLDRAKSEVEHFQRRVDQCEAKMDELRQQWVAAEVDPWLTEWAPGTIDPSAVRSECNRLLREEAARVTENRARLESTEQADRDADAVMEPMRDPFTAAPELIADRLYRVPDGFPLSGEIYRVYKAQAGHLLAARWDGAKFVYQGAAARFAKPEWIMAQDEHMGFGQLFGTCGVCGIVLTDPESIERGIGPVCMKKF